MLHVMRKIMENEENRGLINKKVSEDQLAIFFSCLVSVTFCQFGFGALSLLSLSLTLGHLEFLGALWNWSKKGKEGKRKKI